jgi:hypothetical protein
VPSQPCRRSGREQSGAAKGDVATYSNSELAQRPKRRGQEARAKESRRVQRVRWVRRGGGGGGGGSPGRWWDGGADAAGAGSGTQEQELQTLALVLESVGMGGAGGCKEPRRSESEI